MQNRKTPQIRFKGYTSDWEQRKFRDLGSVAMCKRIFKEQTNEFGEIPFFKIGTFGAEPDAYISRELFEEYKIKFSYPKVGDILISASGSIGRTVEFTGANEYFQDSNIVWLNHNEQLDNSFLKFLYSVVKWSGIEGSTIKRLYNENILNTSIVLPSVEEQKIIGLYFAKLTNLITLHQRKCDKLKMVKKSMISKIFAENGEKSPQIRFKGYTDDWEKCKVIDIAEIRRGLTYKPTDIRNDGIRVLRSSNINEDTFIKGEDDVFVDIKAINIPFAKNGDILITSANGSSRLVGKHAIIREIRNNSMVHGGFMLLATAKNPQFLNALMGASWYTKFINLFVAGGNGAIGNLNKNDLDKQNVFIPSEPEQKIIGQFFENIDHLIILHQCKVDKLKQLKKAMLEKMFV